MPPTAGLHDICPIRSRFIVTRAVSAPRRAEAEADPLSPREREVVQLIAEGLTTKEVASVLGISVKTAEAHRINSMRKLDVHETASLVRYAVRQGLVQP